jgi:hypothetical protein
MFTPTELSEIRQIVDAELAEIDNLCEHAGSYNYLCCVRGIHMLTHRRVGRVLRTIHHQEILREE